MRKNLWNGECFGEFGLLWGNLGKSFLDTLMDIPNDWSLATGMHTASSVLCKHTHKPVRLIAWFPSYYLFTKDQWSSRALPAMPAVHPAGWLQACYTSLVRSRLTILDSTDVVVVDFLAKSVSHVFTDVKPFLSPHH